MQTISRLKMNRQRNRSCYRLSLFKESLTVASRSSHYSYQGYTLIEMIATLVLAGIIAGFAVPSLLSLNKPLRDGAVQFKTQLSLMRSKAISSNQAYRIRPKFETRAEYENSIPRNFVVEYAANCKVNTLGGTNGWQAASQFDLDLPPNVGITDVATTNSISNSLNWNSTTWGATTGICFDNRGIVDNTGTKIVLKDFRGDNRAKVAIIEIGKVGSVDITTYDSNTSATPNAIAADSQGNPVF